MSSHVTIEIRFVSKCPGTQSALVFSSEHVDSMPENG